MICPACQSTLTEKSVNNVSLDVCSQGCGGIWFDRFELKKFDEISEPDVEALLNLKKNPNTKINSEITRMCPKCENMKMMRHFSSVKKQVVIDECPKCSGIWLDAGELTQIRQEFPSEAKRLKATEEFFNQVLKETFKK